MTEPIRVLVVDDQALVRAGFVMILETEPGIEVVGEAAHGAGAVELSHRLAPDVIVMDIRMPEMDGIEATRIIRGTPESAAPRILILTTFDLDEYVYDALRHGASGFLLKDTPPEDLVAAIRVIARGEALLAPSITTRLIAEFAKQPVRPEPPPGLSQLTDRETEVLRHLAQGMSNAEMAEALFVSETTVKSHISHILAKLELRDRVQAVVVAYESGLVTPGAG